MTFTKVGNKKAITLKKATVRTASLLLAGVFLFGAGSVQANQLAQASRARGDDYPHYYKNGSQDIDKWRLYSRQCTSFAAFRLSNANGFELPPAYGNAREWGYRAQREGYRVDKTPTIGSIAWDGSGDYGHVAWVSNVFGDMIEIEEYNYGYTGKYNRRTIKASSMTGFIHFKDLGGTSKAPSVPISPSLGVPGTHLFTEKAAIMNQPSQAAAIIDYYYPGESVHYDQTLEKDGYKWLSYLSRTGSRRYVQLTKTATSKSGWEKQGTTWYYFENGKVSLGWKKINGSWYYFQTSGAMRTGWLKDGSKWYYLKSSGEMQTGWLKDKGIWYYFENSGAMKTDQWFQVSGKYYYVNASGELAVDTTIDGFQVDSNGARVEQASQ